jgi:hypothetical protein
MTHYVESTQIRNIIGDLIEREAKNEHWEIVAVLRSALQKIMSNERYSVELQRIAFDDRLHTVLGARSRIYRRPGG